MAELVDKLADLTGLRDRDVLDVALAGALRDMLQPEAVAVYRRVDANGDPRWLLRARLDRGDAAARSDPAWVELASLPRCSEHPAREQAMAGRGVVVLQPPEEGNGACCAVFPLCSGSEAAGVVEIHTAQPLDAASQRMVSGILSIYRNFRSLLDYSERDTLTGLRNRKTFDDSFQKLVGEAAQAGGGSTWLGVIDIDHFKRVNDVHGHLIGDEVLLMLSRLMRNCFRFNDHVFRFGGEEFVVLMRCASEAHAAQALERLRRVVEGFAFPRVERVTISSGFTEVRPGDSPSGAFQRADRAVYWAKDHGRNQVCSFSERVRAGELSDDAAAAGDVELF